MGSFCLWKYDTDYSFFETACGASPCSDTDRLPRFCPSCGKVPTRTTLEVCVWTVVDGYWERGCNGKSAAFETGTLESNNYFFCDYCGRKIGQD